MRIADQPGTTQQGRIQQRGMIKAILENTVTTPEQGCHHPQVGTVAAGKQQCPRPLHEISELLFQCMMGTAVTGNQVRRAAATTELIHSTVKRGNDIGMIGQSQIVIAAERQIVPAVYVHPDPLGSIDDQATAIQLLISAYLQLYGQVFHYRG
jgi:hypothetical protein